jgi:hypothetical protein
VAECALRHSVIFNRTGRFSTMPRTNVWVNTSGGIRQCGSSATIDPQLMECLQVGRLRRRLARDDANFLLPAVLARCSSTAGSKKW